MKKQTLSVEQMYHLKYLDIDIDSASLHTNIGNSTRCVFNYATYTDLIEFDQTLFPVFTIQDILDLLPICIEDSESKFYFMIKPMIFKDETLYRVFYEDPTTHDFLFMKSNKDLIDALYEMLVWCIKNKYIQTN